MLKVFAEIEHALPIVIPTTINATPVWKFTLWNEYEKKLPFMADADLSYPSREYNVGGLFIDNEQYEKVTSLGICWFNAKTFYVNNNVMYIHLKDSMPAWLFYNFVTGIMYGFTNQEPQVHSATQYLPDLISVPEIEINSDVFSYAKMKFYSGNVVFNNTEGIMDNISNVFGNNLNIRYESKPNEFELLMQYYIAKYSINANTATFVAKDKRERLSNSCPNTFFKREEFPHLEDKYENKVIPDAYGVCKGITAIPINGKQIYVNMSTVPFLDWYTYKIARKITKISRVQIKMRDSAGNDLWVEVFPGLGVPGRTVSDENIEVIDTDAPLMDRNYPYLYANPHPVKIVHTDGYVSDLTRDNIENVLPDNNGTIQIWCRQALRDNLGFLERRGGSTQEVKVDGTFNDLTRPCDIVKDIIRYYSNLSDIDSFYFNVEEWNRNLELLPEIGISLNEKKSIYDYIEQIQNGCLLGWQMLADKDRFTARLDNPNRDETFHIMSEEILNIENVEIEMNGEQFATYTDIRYDRDVADDLWQSVIDKMRQEEILSVYKYDQPFENDSLLLTEDNARIKGKAILDDFSTVRPILRGIELIGREYFNLKLFQIGMIDFTIKLPERLKQLQPFLIDRYFMGRLRCKIIGKRIDLQTEKVVIDVRHCDVSLNLPVWTFEAVDLTGEYPSTVMYYWNVDNQYAYTKENEFDYIMDGGGV